MIPSIALSSSQQATMSTVFRIDSDKTATMDDDFTPTAAQVICGRGKKAFEHAGNVKFRSIVMAYLSDYRKAVTKVQKSAVVSSVFDDVNSDEGAFIKQNPRTLQWFVVSEAAAREKISQCFRDCLNSKISAKDLPLTPYKKTARRHTSKAREAITKTALPPSKFGRSHSVGNRTFARTSQEALQQLLQFSQAARNCEEPNELEQSPSFSCASGNPFDLFQDLPHDDPLSFPMTHDIDSPIISLLGAL